MDQQEDFANPTTKRKSKMLIDSGDEAQEVIKTAIPQAKDAKNDQCSTQFNQTSPYIECISEKKTHVKHFKTENHTLDRSKLKQLFEPDTSRSEEQAEEEEEESSSESRQQKQTKPKHKVNKYTLQQSKRQDTKKVDSLDDLRIEILKRWWYVLDDWPQADSSYFQGLERYKLRKVDFSVFKREPELDEKGFRKVYQVEGFPGVFRTSMGDTLDLRDKETCPSVENISKINPKNLPKLYIKALQAQVKQLQEHEPQNETLATELKTQLAKAEMKFKQYLE